MGQQKGITRIGWGGLLLGWAPWNLFQLDSLVKVLTNKLGLNCSDFQYHGVPLVILRSFCDICPMKIGIVPCLRCFCFDLYSYYCIWWLDIARMHFMINLIWFAAFCQRFYRHLELKSKHPDAPVPPLDDTLKKITQPDPELLSECKSVVDEFRRLFELKENPKVFTTS